MYNILAAQKNNQKKKFNLFSLFLDPNRNGKGVDKAELNAPRNLAYFFKLYGRNITRLLYVNLLMIFGNFPIFFGLFALSGNVSHHSFAPASRFFPMVYSAILHGEANPATMALFGVHGMQSAVTIPSTADYVLYSLTALVLFTFGLVNVGTTYILRNIVKGEPIFLWHDFWYAIKRNWKQGLILGILDLLLSFCIVYGLFFYSFNMSDLTITVLFYISVVLAFIYFLMRFYMYIMVVTFDLSLFKILKNSFIFSLLGIKRNLLALIGIAVIAIVSYTFLIYLPPIGIILPFILVFSHCAFMATYAAFPKIKKVMIDPYYAEHPEEDPDRDDGEEPIFTDLGREE